MIPEITAEARALLQATFSPFQHAELPVLPRANSA
jgi:hypothetical protein